MESTFEYGGGRPSSGYNKNYGGSSSSKSSSGRYHGKSSGSFTGGFGAGKPSYGYSGKKKPGSSQSGAYKTAASKTSGGSKKSYYSKANKNYSSGYRVSHSSHSSRKGRPAYIDRDGALFDQNFNHIPTEKVPVYVKGPGWDTSGLISYGDRNNYGDYSESFYESAYDEISGGGYRPSMPDFSPDLNPYKEMLAEMQKLRQQNLELGKKALSDEADNFYREAYINHTRNMNSLDEKLFNAGSTGGLSESARAYMEASYKNALSDIEKEKLKNIGLLQSEYAEGSAKDHALTMDKVSKETERLRSEKRAYEKMLEERLYREKKAERDFNRKMYEKYYGL